MLVAIGQRLKEASAINKSLSALGDVIMALTSPAAQTAAAANGDDSSSDGGRSAAPLLPPYRNSVLTYLLKASCSCNILYYDVT